MRGSWRQYLSCWTGRIRCNWKHCWRYIGFEAWGKRKGDQLLSSPLGSIDMEGVKWKFWGKCEFVSLMWDDFFMT